MDASKAGFIAALILLVAPIIYVLIIFIANILSEIPEILPFLTFISLNWNEPKSNQDLNTKCMEESNEKEKLSKKHQIK